MQRWVHPLIILGGWLDAGKWVENTFEMIKESWMEMTKSPKARNADSNSILLYYTIDEVSWDNLILN